MVQGSKRGVSLCVCQELSCVLVDWLWGVASFIVGGREESVGHRCVCGQRHQLDYWLGGRLGWYFSEVLSASEHGVDNVAPSSCQAH